MKTALFTSFMAALVLVPAAGAQLECSVVNSACAVGYTDFLHMFSNEDSHAELPSGTDYGWSLCCRGIPGLNNIRQGDPGTDYDVFLRLNLPTNSHVEKNTGTHYTNDVYISVDHGGIKVDCGYTTSPGNTCQDEFGPDYECMLTMNQDTDSHVSDCDGTDDFPVKVCCLVDADTSPPVFTISEPSYEWTNMTSFDVSWSSTDDKSVVVCSNVVWSSSPSGPWTPITVGGTTTSCPSNPGTGSIAFGPGEPVATDDDSPYYFTGNATDDFGNTGTHIGPVVITVDRYRPEIYTGAADEFGRPVEGGLVESGATKVFLNFSSTDNISGVLTSTLYYRLVRYGLAEDGTEECGSAPDHGGWSNCTKDFNYDPDTTIKYHVEARDRAGNELDSGYGFITSHMLANFGLSFLYLTMGETRLVPVMVRNMQALPDDINLTLSGYGFMWFEHDCHPSDCVMSPDRMELSVLNVSPYDDRTYYVRILSSERGEYYPTLSAASALDPSISDQHVLSLTVGYPVYFPGLSSAAVITMLALSGVAMFIALRGRPGITARRGGEP